MFSIRYYYAVATFDTAAAAGHVYGEIDGTEFERTANVFDLSFVPDETSFEGDVIHEEATESSAAAVGPAYQGVEFVTDVSPSLLTYSRSIAYFRDGIRRCDIRKSH